MENIYLIGFMGTGKTTIGKALSNNLNFEFFDIDEEIQKRENMRIVDIFSAKGESYFRNLENSILKELSIKNKLIISCGGGIVINKENLIIMKKTGKLILLTASIDEILKRTSNNNVRPLLNVKCRKEKIENLLKEREPFYNQADIKINTSNNSIEEILEKIINILNLC